MEKSTVLKEQGTGQKKKKKNSNRKEKLATVTILQAVTNKMLD